MSFQFKKGNPLWIQRMFIFFNLENYLGYDLLEISVIFKWCCHLTFQWHQYIIRKMRRIFLKYFTSEIFNIVIRMPISTCSLCWTLQCIRILSRYILGSPQYTCLRTEQNQAFLTLKGLLYRHVFLNLTQILK